MVLETWLVQAATDQAGGASEGTRAMAGIFVGVVLLVWGVAVLAKPYLLTAMLNPGNFIRLYCEEAAWRPRFFASFLVLAGATIIFLGLNMMLHFKFME